MDRGVSHLDRGVSHLDRVITLITPLITPFIRFLSEIKASQTGIALRSIPILGQPERHSDRKTKLNDFAIWLQMKLSNQTNPCSLNSRRFAPSPFGLERQEDFERQEQPEPLPFRCAPRQFPETAPWTYPQGLVQTKIPEIPCPPRRCASR